MRDGEGKAANRKVPTSGKILNTPPDVMREFNACLLRKKLFEKSRRLLESL